jgi:caffeoyl-CoA O-methyltransferase
MNRWGARRVGARIGGVAAGLLLLAVHGGASDDPAVDAKVQAFLEKSRGSWHDWNVPEKDGRILHDIVLKHGSRHALEIGTSTGHSSIWIAWALSKTGGRLTTIEIDPGRHETAVENFKAAGVDGLIDARLGDAHALVKELPGPFDFVFSDADKDWYLQYFKDLEAKVAPGGCFTAHNVLRSGGGGAAAFLDYVKRRPGWETTVETGGGEGISISCKQR